MMKTKTRKAAAPRKKPAARTTAKRTTKAASATKRKASRMDEEMTAKRKAKAPVRAKTAAKKKAKLNGKSRVAASSRKSRGEDRYEIDHARENGRMEHRNGRQASRDREMKDIYSRNSRAFDDGEDQYGGAAQRYGRNGGMGRDVEEDMGGRSGRQQISRGRNGGMDRDVDDRDYRTRSRSSRSDNYSNGEDDRVMSDDRYYNPRNNGRNAGIEEDDEMMHGHDASPARYNREEDVHASYEGRERGWDSHPAHHSRHAMSGERQRHVGNRQPDRNHRYHRGG